MSIPIGSLDNVEREELGVEVVRRFYKDGRVESFVNIAHKGVPRSTMGPYSRHLTMAEALQLVAVSRRIEGEPK